MVNRGVVSTHFLDDQLMCELGLSDNLQWMFEKLGLQQWWGVRYDTYKKYVIEFFSSVKVVNSWISRSANRWMDFRLDGVDHHVTAEQLSRLYGFAVDGLMMEHKVIGAEFWPKISDEKQFISGHTKCTSMKNPVFRCFQKAIWNTILARNDSQNNLRTEELYFIWACFNLDEQIDICYHFMAQIANVASRTRGPITIGGMLTLLFKHLGVDLTRQETAPGSNILDYDVFHVAGLFTKRQNGTFLTDPYIVLPCYYRIDVTDPDNWKIGEAIDEIETYDDQVFGDQEGIGQDEDDDDDEDEDNEEGEDEEIAQEEETMLRVFGMHDIQKSLREIRQEQRSTRQSIKQLAEKMDTMYEWNQAMYHHFFPPPPPPTE